MAKLKLVLFGAKEILLDDIPVHIARRKALAMLIYLVVTERPQERDTLGAMFWPESADSRNQVRVALSSLRAALGAEWFSEYTDVLQISNTQHIWADVLAFRRLCNMGFQQPEQCVEQLEQAIELARGSFLAGFTLRDCPEFNSWLQSEEFYLDRETNKALRKIVKCHQDAGNFERAVHYAEQLVARDSLNEDGYQLLMELYLEHNHIRDVIRVYERCDRQLQDELGITPRQGLQSILQLAMAQRQGKEIEKSEPTDELIPYFHHPFFGRETELNTILNLMENAACRMVSLVGIGGIGKTHLAARISELTPTQLNLDVCFVSLEGIQSQEQALLVIAQRLQLRLMLGIPVLDQIVSHLQPKQLLLVLDNVERFIPVINPILSRIIQQTPGIKLLITSRIMLRMHEEHLVRLGGLAYPHRYDSYKAEEIQACDSVRFFLYWAKKRSPTFQFSENNAHAIAELCHVLEGIPLAIRLAAVWCELLSVEELLREIHQNSNMLQSNLSDVPEKHRSMRALFDSIWLQLSVQEQQAFSQLSIFRGGFTRQAAEQIADITPVLLKSLLEKSLLVVDGDIGRRYRIHEILRMFASENAPLESDNRPLINRYVDYFARFVSALEADLRGSSLPLALRDMDNELANIQKAWNLAVEDGKVDTLSAMMASLYAYMHYRGYWGEGHKLFEIAQTRLAELSDAKTQHFVNWITARFVTASDTIILMLSKLISDAQAYGDAEEVAYLTAQIGWQTSFLGRDQFSLHYFRKAITQYQALSDEFQVAAILRGMAYSEASLGNFSTAIEHNQVSMSIRQRIGDPFGLSINQILQGEIHLLRAEIPLALDNLLSAYDYIEAHDGEPLALKQTKLLPWCYVFAGDVTQGAVLANRLAEVATTLQAHGEHVLALLVLALVAALSGNVYESGILLKRSQDILSDPDLQTGLGKFGVNLQFLSKSMMALSHCLNGSLDEGHAIIAELKLLKASFMRPMIVYLLFTAEVISLYLESHGHLNHDLVAWLSEQLWLTEYLEQHRLFQA